MYKNVELQMAHVVGVPRRDPCQKCQLPVFLAERLTVGKKVYHRTCLKCARCGSQLTPGSFYETEVDGEYCCETCPDEEEQDVAGNSVLLRHSVHDEKSAAPHESAGAQTKSMRGSIADRLAFFEQSKSQSESANAAAGNKLLQKSVSDEEKSKSLRRMEATGGAPTAYKPNSALSSFLNDTLDGAEVESSPTTADDDTKPSTATQMDTSDTDDDENDETEADSSLEQSLPALPRTLPPGTSEDSVPNKRFTATAQLQLAPAAMTNEITAEAVTSHQQAEDKTVNSAAADSVAPTSIGKKKTELELQLTRTTAEGKISAETTATNESDSDSKNNNGHHRTTDVKLETEIEPTQNAEQVQKSLEINLDVSATNDNDHFTKDTIADTEDVAVVKEQVVPDAETLEQIKTELKPLDSESSTDMETSVEPPVELRTKSLKPDEKETQQQKHLEDAATTERLSVVRARLQQFEVIANNHNNNAGPDKDSINVNTNDNDKLSELDTNKLNAKLNNEDSTETSTLTESVKIDKTDETIKIPNENLEDEAKLKAMEIDTVTVENEKEEKSVIEVPMHVETKDNSIDVESKPETMEEETVKPTPAARGESVKSEIAANAARSPGKIKVEEYPEELNPFKSDDEEDQDANKENMQEQQSIAANLATDKKRNSLNPFDSSDDDVELEKSSRNSTASSTPSTKVPPPRPPPPRISRNPFGDGEEDESFSRRSSLSSSLTKKTPVPTPRTNISQSQNPTPEPTPRLSTKTPQSHSSYVLQNSSDYYGSANSLGSTPQSMQRNTDGRGSNNSLTSSAGGTIRSRKSRKAPAPPAPAVKELFPSGENADSSKASTPSSSTVGTPKLGRKKRPAPAPPKPARLDPSIVPQIAVQPESNGTASKNLLSYPLQGESDSKLSDEEKALLEGKRLSHDGSRNSSEEALSRRNSRRLIPLDVSLLEDADNDGDGSGAGGSKSDDVKQQQQQQRYDEQEESHVVYRRVLVPPKLDTPTRESNPLLDELGIEAHDRQLEKLKDNKEAKNRNRQSQISGSSGTDDCDGTPYNKSSYGKWKRRKGPAPALPVPPRKVLQMLPLQEIRHELEIIEVQQQGLEKQGVILEKMIRDRCEGQNGELLGGTNAVDGGGNNGDKGATGAEHVQNSKEVEDLILQLFELVNEKNELFRRQAELMYLRRQHRLEQEQADLEYEIRVLMAQPERNKTDSDKSREEALIARLVEVVQLRNEVVECLEMDRLREAEEDLSIKQRLELHTAQREDEADSKKVSVKLSKKEKKKQKEAKKLSKNKKLDADKDADETELSADKQKLKKKKKKFLF